MSGSKMNSPVQLISEQLGFDDSLTIYTNPGRMENWVSLGGKQGRTNIQISAELGI